MNDDLLDRLKTTDPASPGRIAREARALGNLPARITGGELEPTGRRLPVSRRRVAIALAATLLAVGVALPLLLLSPLGNHRPKVGPAGGGWYAAGSFDELLARRVTYLPEVRVFVVASPGDVLYALSAVSPHQGETLLYCKTSGWFFSPEHGEQFDVSGRYELGPAPNGMDGVALRIVDGVVQVNPSTVTPGLPRTVRADPEPSGPYCQGDYKEVAPGVVVADVQPPQPPPIEVAAPQLNQVVSSPIEIRGSADVFDGAVGYLVLDERGNVIARGETTTTCGAGCRGDFGATVAYSVKREQPGTVQVFEASPKDGSPIVVVRIPVVLEP